MPASSAIVKPHWQRQAERHYRHVRAYFLRKIGDEHQWRKVTTDPRLFNLIWRQSLELPATQRPPPSIHRAA